MALWKKLFGGVILTLVVIAGTGYWRINRSGPKLVSVDTKIRLVEKPCDKALLPARCGVVIAPLDYNNPAGKTVEIGFVRYPALGFTDKVLQLVGGGPGTAITVTLKQGGGAAVLPMRAMMYNRSLLFVEPRGIALSTQLNCPVGDDIEFAMSSDPSFKQKCADQIGPDAQFYTTENTARDFNQVRKALGIAEIDLYGFSYGTMLSAVYTSLFPKHVRTLGLDGALPVRTWEPFMPTNHAAMKRQILQACDRSKECKADEVFQALKWATGELRKAPRSLGSTEDVSFAYMKPYQLDAASLANLATQAPQPDQDQKTGTLTWRLPFIAALLKAYQQKDWSDLDALAVRNMSILKKNYVLSNGDRPFTLNMVITCRDWAVPWQRTSTFAQRQLEYAAAAAAHDREQPNAFAPFTAHEWGMRRGMASNQMMCPVQQTALPAQSDKTYTWPDALPVLVLNADYDFQTVNEDAELAAGQFKNAQFARFKYHGHAILPESTCAFGLLREFLDNKRVANPMKCLDADAAAVSIEKAKQK